MLGNSQRQEAFVMKGPFLYNWLAWQHGAPSCGAIEAGLFSDAHVTGSLDEGYGPYRFINNVAIPEVIILRADIHIPDLYSADTTDLLVLLDQILVNTGTAVPLLALGE